MHADGTWMMWQYRIQQDAKAAMISDQRRIKKISRSKLPPVLGLIVNILLYCKYNLNRGTYGYLTWEWREGLRGFSYPLIFASIYKILQFISCDSVHLLVPSLIETTYSIILEFKFTKFPVRLFLQIWLPRIVQALLAALADVKFFSLIRTLENGDVATWTVSFPLNDTVKLKTWKLWLLVQCVLVSSSSATCARGSRGTAAPGLWPTAWRPPSPLWLFVTSPSQSPKHTAGLDLHHLWKIILLVHFLMFSFFSSKTYLSLVALAVVIRPTALIVWVPLLVYHFWKEDDKLRLVTREILPIGFILWFPPSQFYAHVLAESSFFPFHSRSVALLISTVIDCMFYEKVKHSTHMIVKRRCCLWSLPSPLFQWTVVQFNFLKFNIFHGVADFYGSHPWHWYFTQGFAVVIGPHLPLFLHGCVLGFKKYKILLVAVVWTLVMYR